MHWLVIEILSIFSKLVLRYRELILEEPVFVQEPNKFGTDPTLLLTVKTNLK